MNLQKLFDMQRKLDERIVKEKGLEGKDLLSKKIMSLHVELGEMANELPEVFKFWSNKKNNYEKALKEYVDAFHFILSIGNDLIHRREKTDIDYSPYEGDALHNFHFLIETFAGLWNFGETDDPYGKVIRQFLRLGEQLGFTWEQIEQAYMDKNAVNHTRQDNGY